MLTKTNAIQAVLAATLACALTGCRSDPSQEGKSKRLMIAVIPKGTTQEFWKAVHYGAAKAGEELDVDVVWLGPQTENDREQQLVVVENFITQGVDGICLAPLDSQALIGPVRDAGREGIPVVLFDSGLDDTECYVSYVATDNYRGGELAAKQMAQLLNGKGNVILLRYAPGSESTGQREEGFLSAIGEYPDITVISSDQYAGISPESALDKSQQLLNRYRDQVDGIFTVNESSTTGMLGAMQEAGVAEKVNYIGFDPNSRTARALQAGTLKAIVAQDPVQIGYQAVTTMVEHLSGKKVEKRISTGEHIVTAENLDDPKIRQLLSPPRFGEP